MINPKLIELHNKVEKSYYDIGLLFQNSYYALLNTPNPDQKTSELISKCNQILQNNKLFEEVTRCSSSSALTKPVIEMHMSLFIDEHGSLINEVINAAFNKKEGDNNDMR